MKKRLSLLRLLLIVCTIGCAGLLLGITRSSPRQHARQSTLHPTVQIPSFDRTVSPEARARVQQAFQGDDLKGKDGPPAKAGPDLLMLYHEYQAFQRQDGEGFTPSQSGIRVSDRHVTIDALAATQATQIRSDIKALGLEDAAIAGRVVSGKFPISQIPDFGRTGITAERDAVAHADGRSGGHPVSCSARDLVLRKGPAGSFLVGLAGRRGLLAWRKRPADCSRRAHRSFAPPRASGNGISVWRCRGEVRWCRSRLTRVMRRRPKRDKRKDRRGTVRLST